MEDEDRECFLEVLSGVRELFQLRVSLYLGRQSALADVKGSNPRVSFEPFSLPSINGKSIFT
ncbi:MAG: hypothetical protein ABGX42_03570 [Gammaproteobacteria bacterium]|jgi:hypothetical protein